MDETYLPERSVDADEVIEGERQLLDPGTRADPAAVRELLHPAFREFGASGRIWDLDTVTAALEAELGAADRAVEMRDAVAIRVGPEAMLLTYTARAEARGALRSSLWVRDTGRWRLLFHQGTAHAR